MSKSTIQISAASRYQTNAFLVEAVKLGQHDMVQLYLKLGANINIKNKFGDNLLFVAIAKKDLAMVELLLANNIETKVPNKFNIAAIEFASLNDAKEIVELINNHQIKSTIEAADLDPITVFDEDKPSSSFSLMVKKFLLGWDVNDCNSPVYEVTTTGHDPDIETQALGTLEKIALGIATL